MVEMSCGSGALSRIVLLACVVLLFSSGAALSASTMVEAFKEYQAALKTGDIIKADEAGERAWKLAAQAGKSKTEAVLAYNLAELRLRYLPNADALTPARRMAEIKASGVAVSVEQEKIAIALALSEYKQNKSGENLRLLKQAVKSYKTSELPATYSLFSAEMDLIRNAIEKGQWKQVNGLSIGAQQSYQENGLSDTNLLIDLKFLQIASIVKFDMRRKANRYQQIFQDIYDLRALLPEDEPVESYYKFQAWLGAVNAYLDSRSRRSGKLVKLVYRDADETKSDLCPEFVWDRSDLPEYPHKQLEKEYVGAAVIVYNLNQDGETENVSIGYEVPSELFGKYATIAVEKWHGHFVSNPSKECLTKLKFVAVSFKLSSW